MATNFQKLQGSAHRSSNIDVPILPLAPLPRGLLSEIREALEESQVINHVDVVDLSDVSDVFRIKVLREGLPCRD